MGDLAGDTRSIIRLIQAGDELMREQFIAARLSLVRQVTAQITHRYFVEQEDEYEIALEAFNDAINHYKPECSASFETYAHLVIRNRIYDWLRKQKSLQRVVSLSEQDFEDGLTLEEKIADPHSEDVQQNLEFAEEMVELELNLQAFGLKLGNLTDHFPKHRDSRLVCIQLARQIAADSLLFDRLMTAHQVPGKELAARSQVPIKTIEKNRASIILLTLLMKGSFETIQGYLIAFERGCPK